MAEQKILISIQVQDKAASKTINQTASSLGKLEKSQKRVANATDKNRATSGLNNAILMETSRLASDASFGFTAIANNLSQLINLFKASKDATGSYRDSLKSLFRIQSLFLVAIQLLITFLPKIIKSFKSVSDEIGTLSDALLKATSSVEGQITTLKEYQSLLNDNNLSLAQKEKLLKKVVKETGIEVLNLDNSNKLSRASNNLLKEKINLIVTESKVKAITQRIEDLELKRKLELNKVDEKANSITSEFISVAAKKAGGLNNLVKEVTSTVLGTNTFGKVLGKIIPVIETTRKVQKEYSKEVNSSEAITIRDNIAKSKANKINEEYSKAISEARDELTKLITQLLNGENALGLFEEKVRSLSMITFQQFSNANQQMRDMTEDFSVQLINSELERNKAMLKIERDFYLTSIDQSIASEIEKQRARAAVIAFFNKQIEDEDKRHFMESLDMVQQSFDDETAIAKAALLVKQAIALQEVLIDAGVLKSKASKELAETTLDLAVAKKDVAAGGAKIAKTANPLAIAGYALTAASIIATMVKAVKGVEQAAGGGAGAGTTIQAPSFNVVGASQTQQLAETVAGQQAKPIKAFVVGKDISTQQELDRNITNTASFG